MSDENKIVEIWKDIPGYEGKYQVSNFGRVKSLARTMPHKLHGKWFVRERILKQFPVGNSGNQYLGVFLHKGCGEQHIFRVHRLVADAFIAKVPGKPEVNHKDCDKTNNYADNLEWVSGKENSRHAWAHGRCNNVGWRKHAVKNIDTGELFDSVMAACAKYNVTNKAIYQAAKNPNLRCCGFHWKYLDEV